MTHCVGRAGTRFLVAALATIALGFGAFALLAPKADAAEAFCDPGEFCMWIHADFAGGLYEFSGSDRNLDNDHFLNLDKSTIVNNQASSVWNFGNRAARDDVRAYDGLSWGGASTCFPRETYNSNLGAWNDRISSYRWVASC